MSEIDYTATRMHRDGIDRAHDDFNASIRERRAAAMDAYCCPECGSPSGMAGIAREYVTPGDGPWYRVLSHESHDLYTPCWACNRRRRIPAGYEPVDAEWVRDWLARECRCADCERERRCSQRDNHAPADGNGRRGVERMYR